MQKNHFFIIDKIQKYRKFPALKRRPIGQEMDQIFPGQTGRENYTEVGTSGIF